MSSARPDAAYVDSFGPGGCIRWAEFPAQSMGEMFAPVPDPRTGPAALRQGGPGQGGPGPSGGSAQVSVPRRRHWGGTRRWRRQWGHGRCTHAMLVPPGRLATGGWRPASAHHAHRDPLTGYFVWRLLKDLLNQQYRARWTEPNRLCICSSSQPGVSPSAVLGNSSGSP